MIGLAADHHADADIAVVAAAFGGEGDRAGHFERAGDGEHFHFMPGSFERGARACYQHVIEVVVETGFDDQETGHAGHSGMGLWSTILRP